MTPESEDTREGYIGVDIGGTFTDVVLQTGSGTTAFAKHPTTPADPAEGVVGGVRAVLESSGLRPDHIRRVVHATTLATNLVLAGAGAKVAHVTTKGFRDTVLLGRQSRVGADRYDLQFERALPPVPRERVFEVDERILATGEISTAVAEDDLVGLVADIVDCAPDAVSICLLHSYVNPVHERLVADAIRLALPDAHISVSSQIWPEFREYDRAMTTMMSAYVGPLVERYLVDLQARLRAIGITAPLQVMQSNGGISSAQAVAERAVYAIESGPAAGVIAAGDLGRTAGHPNVISLDMGGTTAKAGLVRDGRPVVTHDFRVGGHASAGGRHAAGFPIRIPVVDLAEVGSGGGSLAWIDPGGLLKVGPRSAGADPGPACFDRGGTEPTVTDADLVLGYLDPDTFAGGQMAISVGRAREAIRRHVAVPLGVDVVTAAYGIYRIANANMAAAIRIVTVERGIDPTEFTAFAFGGAGPVHVADLVREFRIPHVVIPTLAGLNSAVGLLASDVATDHVRTAVMDPAHTTPTAVNDVFEELERAARKDISSQGIDPAVPRASYAIDMRFKHQTSALSVPLSSVPVTPEVLARAVEGFHAAYRGAAGADRRDPVELVSFHVRLTAPVERPRQVEGVARPGDGAAARQGERPVFFEAAGGFVPTAILTRDGLVPGDAFDGPAVVEAPDTTVVVPPGCHGSIDRFSNIVLEWREQDG